jgi:hypothetical protein
MALRPIFLAISSATSFVRTIDIEFKWHPGMSVSQKQTCPGRDHFDVLYELSDPAGMICRAVLEKLGIG